MNQEQILKKAIEKAVNNGWRHEHIEKKNGEYVFWDPGLGEWGEYYEPSPYQIIFNHDFAKAFFGEDEDPSTMWCDSCGNALGGWQYHLQQMVLEPDPILYLAKFI